MPGKARKVYWTAGSEAATRAMMCIVLTLRLELKGGSVTCETARAGTEAARILQNLIRALVGFRPAVKAEA